MLEPVAEGLLHLSAGGVSLVLDTRGAALPAVLYWGADLGAVSAADLAELVRASQAPFGDSRIDVPERVSVLLSPAEGWVGRPGVAGSVAGQAFSPAFRILREEAVGPGPSVAAGRRFTAGDPTAELGITLDIQLTRSGLVQMRAALTNDGASGYQLDGLVLALPVPSRAAELFDLTGRHARERGAATRAVRRRHPFPGIPAGPAGARFAVPARGRCPGLRMGTRTGLGPARGLVGQPGQLRGADVQRPAGAGWR